jgi:hypothetical protein
MSEKFKSILDIIGIIPLLFFLILVSVNPLVNPYMKGEIKPFSKKSIVVGIVLFLIINLLIIHVRGLWILQRIYLNQSVPEYIYFPFF